MPPSKPPSRPVPPRLAALLADQYQIIRELGSGGMATVYLAKDVKHDREVALKVLRPELAAVLGAERFLNEIRITARLDHPHILTLIDSGAAEGFLYYVLPFVRGESLRERMVKERQLSLEEALRIGHQVASALDYADRQGVVHRDIKPENILIQEGEAILADFGIALAVKEAGGDRLTETGLSLGTPHYMSPEQATGDRQLDARSDVYSLGAVMYEMIAGEPPHSGPSVQAVIAKLITERPTKLRVLRDTVPAAVEAAVAKALAKVPSDRFATAGEFAKALESSVHRTHAPHHTTIHLPSRGVLFGGGAVALLAVAMLGVWIGKASRGGGSHAAAVVLRDRTKLTSTGHIRLPAISGDGKQLAYVTSSCTSAGCAYAVELQDVGFATTRRVLEGASNIYYIVWSPDRRNLLLGGTVGGRSGLYLVSALGGTPRLLPTGAAGFFAEGDSLLLAGPAGRGGSLWIHVAGLDGTVRDSIALAGVTEGLTFLSAIPNTPWLVAGITRQPNTELRVIDRQGKEADRKTIRGTGLIRAAQDATWLQVAQSGPMTALVRIPFDAAAGRLSGGEDTVYQGTSTGFGVTGDGHSLVMEEGTTDYEVWALDFKDAIKGAFTQDKRLLLASSPISAIVSPDGARLIVRREVGMTKSADAALSVIGFTGGTETPLTVRGKLISVGWADSATIRLAEQEGGKVHFVLVDARTMARREDWSPPDSTVLDFDAFPGGGWVWIPADGHSIHVQRHSDRAPHIYPKPDWYWTLSSAYVSPDGRRIAYLGYDATTFDSLRLTVQSLADSSLVPWITALSGEGASFGWLSDGSIRFTINPTVETQTVYHLKSAGAAEWLGTIPRPVASVAISRDLKRATVTLSDYHADAWMNRVVRP